MTNRRHNLSIFLACVLAAAWGCESEPVEEPAETTPEAPAPEPPKVEVVEEPDEACPIAGLDAKPARLVGDPPMFEVNGASLAVAWHGRLDDDHNTDFIVRDPSVPDGEARHDVYLSCGTDTYAPAGELIGASVKALDSKTEVDGNAWTNLEVIAAHGPTMYVFSGRGYQPLGR